jgi:hypothetical protein
VGFNENVNQEMIQMRTGPGPAQGENKMQDLLIALAFIGMIILPALVAAKSSNAPAEE